MDGVFGRVMGCEWGGGKCPWNLRMLKHWPGEGRRQTGKLPITVDTPNQKDEKDTRHLWRSVPCQDQLHQGILCTEPQYAGASVAANKHSSGSILRHG